MGAGEFSVRGARVVVVGAGVQGSSVALRLAGAGRKVVVLERAVPGAEASSAAGGILSPGVEAAEPGPFYSLCRASLDRYPEFVREVEALSGMSVAYRGGGTLEVALDDTQAQGGTIEYARGSHKWPKVPPDRGSRRVSAID